MKTKNTRKFMRKLGRMLMVASANGGMMITPAGGTANVLAGEVSRSLKIDYNEAHALLDTHLNREFKCNLIYEDWYTKLSQMQPWQAFDWEAAIEARFDVRTIVKAAAIA